MAHYRIETTEKVHGVYSLEADNVEHARELFEQGSVQPPSIYEELETEIDSIVVDESLAYDPDGDKAEAEDRGEEWPP